MVFPWLKEKWESEGRCMNCGVKERVDGIKSCAQCQSKYKSYYERTAIDRRASMKSYRDQLRLDVLTHYSDGDATCACCGEAQIEFLTIDHINNDGAKHRREVLGKNGNSAKMYRWLRDNDYPQGLQVLCWNCNEAKAHYEVCPHQPKNDVTESPVGVVQVR